MFKTIIFALMFTSLAATAAPGGGGGEGWIPRNSAELSRKLNAKLNCDAQLVAQLSEQHQGLLFRLKLALATYESSEISQGAWNAAGLEANRFYENLTLIAGRLLNTQNPDDHIFLDILLNSVEHRMDVALGRIPNPNAGKRRMETRGFEDDWSQNGPVTYVPMISPRSANRSAANPNIGDGIPEDMPHGPHKYNTASQTLNPNIGNGIPEGMPHGPHDFNVVRPKPVVKPGDDAFIGHTDDFGGSRWRPRGGR